MKNMFNLIKCLIVLVRRKDINKLLKDTTLIEDSRLSYEVYLVKSMMISHIYVFATVIFQTFFHYR